MRGNKIHHEGTKDAKVFVNSNSELRTTILQNLRETRKFFASRNSRIRIFLAPSRQERQVRKSFFTLRLCVIAGNVPILFGCGFAALGSLRFSPLFWLRLCRARFFAVRFFLLRRQIYFLGCGFTCLSMRGEPRHHIGDLLRTHGLARDVRAPIRHPQI